MTSSRFGLKTKDAAWGQAASIPDKEIGGGVPSPRFGLHKGIGGEAGKTGLLLQSPNG